MLQICIVDVDYLCISVESSSMTVYVLSFFDKSDLDSEFDYKSIGCVECASRRCCEVMR